MIEHGEKSQVIIFTYYIEPQFIGFENIVDIEIEDCGFGSAWR